MNCVTHTISNPISGKRVYVVSSKLGIDATKKIPGEGFKRPWPPLIKMDEAVCRRIEALFKTQ
jgi:3-polyprenyl-4-hydroxybenzoate decarboxylase